MRINPQPLLATVLGLAASSSFALGGRIVDLYGAGKADVVVTSGDASATTDADGIWSIGETNAIGERASVRLAGSARHFALVNGRLVLTFGGRSVLGRSLAGWPSAAGIGNVHPVAPREAGPVKDTFTYAWNGKVFLRDTTSERTRGGIVAVFDTTVNASLLYGWLADPRDRQVYRTVRIGTQVWMTQDLNYATDSSWPSGDHPDSTAKYGRLYPWAQAMGLDDSCNAKSCERLVPTRPQGICPDGWHMPLQSEWSVLLSRVDPANSGAAKALMSAHGWPHPGTDAFGFHGMPSGMHAGASFYDLGSMAIWRSATEHSASEAEDRNVSDLMSVVSTGLNDKTYGFSVRCIKGNKPQYSVVTGAPNGSILLDPAEGPYDSGTVVTATATADSGFVFRGWSGACRNSSGACVMTMDGEKTLMASITDPTTLPATTAMKQIPAGTFVMGSPLTESGRSSYGETQHTVTLSSFLMDATDVTQGRYAALMGTNPSRFVECGSDCPVENVSWFDAALYCNARSKSEGLDTVYRYAGMSGTYGRGASSLAGLSVDLGSKGYRLPTEAQWEYAARGGTATAYFWGDDTALAIAGQYAWIPANSLGSTHTVAAKLPNGYGLYDMTGNVWQWTGDEYGDYPVAAATDPYHPGSGIDMVQRGGAFKYALSNLRAAFRNSNSPGTASEDAGFRCVRPVP